MLGFRPESVFPAGEATAGPVIELAVEVCELMGAETCLHLQTGAHPVTARLRGGETAEPGQRRSLRLDLAQAHLFDAATGQARR